MKTAIIYASDSGTTQIVANKIGELLPNTTVLNVEDIKIDDLNDYSNFIVGSATIGFGELHYSWDNFINDFSSYNFDGKTVALFGVGDSQSYPLSFAGSVREFYDALKDKNCKIVGEVSTEGYDFEESSAVVDGKFLGLAIDEDNEEEKTDERIRAWVNSIENSFKL